MFVVKRSHHNPILVPYKDHYFEAFATFNMSVIKVGKIFYGVYRAVSAVDKLRTLEQISTIGIGESKDGTYFEERRQFIKPEEEWEKYGCEDPRVTYFEGQYYIFYTALSKYPFEASGIKVAVAVSKDLKKVNERHLVTPFNAKDMTLFGERVGGKVTVIVAVNTDMPPAKIAIAQMDRIEELWNVKFWEEWYKNIDKHVVDLKRLPYDLLGHVPDVIFPSGALVKKDTLFIYYGAADMTACVAHVNLNDLISTMRSETSERWNFKRYLKNPIITPKTTHPWEAKATFNPAVLRLGDTTHILYRALSADNTSSIGYAASKDGVNIDERLSEPIYSSRESFESKKVAGANSGCEDPRLTKIGKTIYMCYTAFDGIGPARVAITSISEKNFLQKNWKWEKPVVITPEGFDDKDTCIFPEKTKGKYFILHRVGDQICGDYFKTLNFKNETVKKCIRIIGPRINSWDSSKVGITAPPIKTKYGWLLLYHGVSKSHNTYRVGAVLLDKNDPALVISRTTDPIFEPREPYEKLGIVNNVVFTCGMALQDDLLYIYYGAADSVVGVATVELNIILKALTRDIKKKK